MRRSEVVHLVPTTRTNSDKSGILSQSEHTGPMTRFYRLCPIQLLPESRLTTGLRVWLSSPRLEKLAARQGRSLLATVPEDIGSRSVLLLWHRRVITHHS